MSTLVMKFGGTSVGSTGAIKQCVKIIADARKNWLRTVVITSALSSITDLLLDAVSKAAAGDNEGIELITSQLHDRHLTGIEELVKDPSERLIVASEIGKLLDQFSSLCQAVMVLGEASPRAHDAISSLGERMSSRILSAALRSSGIASEAVDATRLIITDNQYQSANPDFKASLPTTIEILEPLFTKGITPVVTGFIGATNYGVTTTLGRGGSDFTAAILGVLLKADEVWIWTDVDGVMTSDPRIVPAALTIERISFREISELAYFGAKVLHPKTIRPIIEAGITLKVLNTFNPDHPGTLIVPDMAIHEEQIIKAVTIIKDLRLITIEGRGMLGVPGVAARTFGAIAATGTSVPLISQASSEQSICFAVPAHSAELVVKKIEGEFEREIARRDIDSVWASDEVVIISVVGAGMRNIPGVAGNVFGKLGENRVNVIAIAQGSSEVSISFIVSAQDGTRAVKSLHELIQ
jgi:aspartokinase/homoserine dehydrogenase 1